MSNLIEEIFGRAIEQGSLPEREAFLRQAFEEHPDLRADVEALILAYDRAGSFLLTPLVDPGTSSNCESTVAAPAAPPAQIGPYRLLEELGRGRMGAVYLAEQTAPVRRRVALKLIKPGMDSVQILKRFEAERQALAMMDHSHIAKVYDAGTTPGGHPYFVMELIKGVPITQYCEELNLTLRERVQLLIPVCHAIHHAHQKGVIHRDIKPSNVLVAIQDGEPVPKVIGFGVAKATHQTLTPQAVFTDFGAVIGSLDYMSPEQAELNRLDIDTRVDVYAFGAVLYELLTGRPPLDRKSSQSSDILTLLTRIREETPRRPSTQLSLSSSQLGDLARNMKTDPTRLRKELRGDFDWIVMKCLWRQRQRNVPWIPTPDPETAPRSASKLHAPTPWAAASDPSLLPQSIASQLAQFLIHRRKQFLRSPGRSSLNQFQQLLNPCHPPPVQDAFFARLPLSAPPFWNSSVS